MVVQDILDFINQLQSQHSLPFFDKTYLNELITYFKERSSIEKLTEQDIEFLKVRFAHRWFSVADGEYDYCRRPGEVNQYWIELAHKLAKITGKTYLQILFPTVENTIDFNNFTSLIETAHPENLYLGYGGKALFRKRGLCEHLIKESKYLLSTSRNFKKFSPVTIDELMRLKWNNKRKAEFSISGEIFFNFWDFLQKKVFPHLQSKGNMPIQSLIGLYELVGLYYSYKSRNEEFSEFKRLVHQFLTSIYRLDLNQLNYLYGIQLNKNKDECYLFEFLIDIYAASTYGIDEQMQAIANWLYRYNPIFVMPAIEQSPSQSSADPIAQATSGWRIMKKPRSLETQIIDVKLLLISLLVGEFETSPFGSSSIHFWDTSNKVFSNGADIFNHLMPNVLSNNTNKLLSNYSAVLNNKVVKHQKSCSVYYWLTEYQSTKQWYKCVEQGELNKLGIYWFDPELLMHALVKSAAHDSALKGKIDFFLDALVHTYAQKEKDHIIQFRVNLLFAQFLKKCEPHERKNVLMLIELHSGMDYKSNFLKNCVFHVIHRLNPNHFTTGIANGHALFSTFNWPDPDSLISKCPQKSVGDAIDEMKSVVHSHEKSFNERTYKRITSYLSLMSRPILTFDEMEEAKQTGRALDYLGAPT